MLVPFSEEWLNEMFYKAEGGTASDAEPSYQPYSNGPADTDDNEEFVTVRSDPNNPSSPRRTWRRQILPNGDTTSWKEVGYRTEVQSNKS